MRSHRILIAGATGLVGAAAARHFATRPGWEVITLSRRQPAYDAPGVHHVTADLQDADACRAALRGHRPATHVLYAALFEEPDLEAGWHHAEHTAVNRAMLRSALDMAEDGGALEHVTILQGGKAYGSHLGPVRVPAKERWPRIPHPVFYWPQEDLLRERAAAGGWSFNILRPQMILGHAQASPMNIVAAIGAYAVLRKEMGLPLSFPGGGRHVTACSDSRLIAQAAEFCATTPSAHDETFNVMNGDAFVWQDMWPAIAAHFGMPVGEAEPVRLTEAMPQLAGRWDEVVRAHGLRPLRLDQLVGSSWQMADIAFGYGNAAPPHRFLSPVKLRQAGFAGCMDTEDALLHWLTVLQDEKLIPVY